MMDRRCFLSVAAISAVFATPRLATAQSFKVPRPEDLLLILRTPGLVEKIAVGTSALRTLLLFEQSRITKYDKPELWQRDADVFFGLLQRLRDPAAREVVAKLLETKDPHAYSSSINEKAIPHVKRMEESLAKGGLPSSSLFSQDLLTSFLHVNRFLVALSPSNEGWYCHIYPLSIFCG